MVQRDLELGLISSSSLESKTEISFSTDENKLFSFVSWASFAIIKVQSIVNTTIIKQENTNFRGAFLNKHEDYMSQCLKLAASVSPDEVPVAALLVDISTGEILASGVNSRETEQSVLAHAEINAIREASKKIGSWNLSGYALYASLEPCAMCAGAILQSHISKIVFGAYEPKTGAFGSRYNLVTKNIEVTGGILEEESLELLKKFFEGRRS